MRKSHLGSFVENTHAWSPSEEILFIFVVVLDVSTCGIYKSSYLIDPDETLKSIYFKSFLGNFNL
jgi:predicted secreted protein